MLKKLFLSKAANWFFLIAAAIVILANASNPPDGRTGAPFDGSCEDCHSPANNAYNGSITLNGLPASVNPGQVYTINFTVTATGNPTRAGFQMVAVDAAEANAGSFTAGTGSGTNSFGGRTYIEHRNPRNFTAGTVSWSFTWTAPASASGNSITFYATANLCNGSGTGGDKVIQTLETVVLNAGGGGSPLSTITTVNNNVSCFGGNNGSATTTPDGGTPPYTYLWSNGETGATANALTAGPKSVTVTDAAGGQTTGNVTITQPTNIIASANSSNNINCTNPSATLTANASGGAGGFSYSWSNGDIGNPITVAVAGTYVVTVTDANDCTKTAQVTVTQNTTAPLAIANAGTITCATPNATLQGSSNVTGAQYAWTGPGGYSSSQQNAVTSIPGDYTLTVTNPANGCTNTASATVNENTTAPGATATGGTLSCSQPNIQLQGSSPTTGVNYSWSGPGGYSSSQQNPVVNTAGNYTLTVTNPSNGCTSTSSATVTSNVNPPGATASGGTLTCTTNSVTLQGNSGTSGVTYAWTGPGGYSSTAQSPSVNTAGTYTLTVTNPANSCTSTAQAVVSSNQAVPGATATGGTLTCTTTSVTLQGSSGTSGVTYAWAGPGGYSSTAQSPSVNTAGNYTLTVTNPANGCTSTATAVVGSNQNAPGATATGGTLTCTTSSVTLQGSSGTSGVTYAWTGPGGYNSTAQSPSVNTAGNYTLTVTNPANGCTSTATATVGSNQSTPGATATGGALTCASPNVTLQGASGTSGVNFAWTGPGGYSSTAQSPSVNTAGNYTLTVTNPANGCTSTASTTVTVNQTAPGATAAGGTITCSSAAVQLQGNSGTSGVTYAWAGPGGYTSSSQNPTVSVVGNYSLTVTNPANGCTSTATATVNADTNLPNASATGGTITCAQTCSNIAGTSTTSGVTYTWTGPNGYTATGASQSVCVPGLYVLTVTGAGGCTAQANATVLANTTGPTLTTTATPITCTNNSSQLNVSADPAGVSFAWAGPNNFSSTLPNPVTSSPGNYTVIVTGANGCTTQSGVTVTQDANIPVLTVAAPTITCTNDCVVVKATSSTPGSTFLWTLPDGTQSRADSVNTCTGGNFTVVTTAPNGCSATQMSTVQTDTVPPANCTYTGPPALTCAQPEINLAATYSGPANATFYWTGPNSYESHEKNPGITNAGNYQVAIQLLNGCTCTTTFSIADARNLTATTTVLDEPLCSNSSDGKVSIQVSGGTTPYTYSGNLDLNALAAGAYTITITDAGACTNVQSFTLRAPDPVAAQVFITQPVAPGALQAVVSGGVSPYLYDWTLNGQTIATTSSPDGLEAGTYFLEVTDANGCSFDFGPFLINTSVATQGLAVKHPAYLSPNPVHQVLQLQWKETLPFELEIRVLNHLGVPMEKILHQGRVLTIDTGALPSGAYLVLITGPQYQQTLKFIKSE